MNQKTQPALWRCCRHKALTLLIYVSLFNLACSDSLSEPKTHSNETSKSQGTTDRKTDQAVSRLQPFEDQYLTFEHLNADLSVNLYQREGFSWCLLDRLHSGRTAVEAGGDFAENILDLSKVE